MNWHIAIALGLVLIGPLCWLLFEDNYGEWLGIFGELKARGKRNAGQS